MKSASAPATDRQTEVFDRLAGSAARWLSHSRSATILSSAAAFASLRAFRPSSPPSDFAHSSAKIASRSEEHTSELQSLMRISYAVFCLKKTDKPTHNTHTA